MLQAVLTFLAFTAAAAACLTAAQAASYPDCPGVQEDWLPECWIAGDFAISIDVRVYDTIVHDADFIHTDVYCRACSSCKNTNWG
jgi:hypothetical protein